MTRTTLTTRALAALLSLPLLTATATAILDGQIP